MYRISPDEPWRIVRTRWRIAGVVKGVVEGGGRVSGYFTGATGATVYRGGAYGNEFANNVFVGDAGGQLVHWKKVYVDGVSLIGRRPPDEQNFEFGASTDTWVRPVNFANAPDGCLHVIDMYREVIEHPWSIPDEIKKHLDLNSGSDRGRIYRIVPDGPAAPLIERKVSLGNASTGELVALLQHPNGWQRDCAARLLFERQDQAAVPMLEEIMRSPGDAKAKIHALAVLDGLNALNARSVGAALTDQDPWMRERAVVTAITMEQHRASALGGPDYTPLYWNAIAPLADDPSPRVRFHAALAAGYAGVNVRAPFLAKLAGSDSSDLWISAAMLNGADTQLFASLQPRLDTLDPSFVERLIGVIAAQPRTPATNAALLDTLTAGTPKASWIRAFGEGLKKAGTAIPEVDTEKRLALVFDKAAMAAKDSGAPERQRIEAIHILTVAAPAQAESALLACIEDRQPESIQAAALAVLGQIIGVLIRSCPRPGRNARTQRENSLSSETHPANLRGKWEFSSPTKIPHLRFSTPNGMMTRLVESKVVRPQSTHSMKLIALFFPLVAASLFCRGETTLSGTQDGRPLSVTGSQAPQVEKLAKALLVSSDYEAPGRIATEARWKQVLGASHIHIVFSEPRKFWFRFSTSGPARVQEVSAEEVLIPISHEDSPDYVFVRFHDQVRAFAKFSCDAGTALQKILPPRSHQ